jgi:hypothetical protein
MGRKIEGIVVLTYGPVEAHSEYDPLGACGISEFSNWLDRDT